MGEKGASFDTDVSSHKSFDLELSFGDPHCLFSKVNI